MTQDTANHVWQQFLSSFLLSGHQIPNCGSLKCRHSLLLAESRTSEQFYYVIASLAPEFAAEIRDLILTPPAKTPYDVLKETLTYKTDGSLRSTTLTAIIQW